MTITESELAELEALLGKATPGEWRYWEDADVPWHHPQACGYDARHNHATDPYYCTGPNCATAEQACHDARLIVALRNSAPALIGALRAAWAENEQLRVAAEKLPKGSDDLWNKFYARLYPNGVTLSMLASATESVPGRMLAVLDENAALKKRCEELRGCCIGSCEDNSGACILCDGQWPVADGPERHKPGCIAAPTDGT